MFFLILMVEILVYKTPEEAEQQLEKYHSHNIVEFKKFFETVKQSSHTIEDLLDTDDSSDCSGQMYFVAELVAYAGDGGSYYCRSKHILGYSPDALPVEEANHSGDTVSLADVTDYLLSGFSDAETSPALDIGTFVQDLKEIASKLRQYSENIVTVFYTVENHDVDNSQEMQKTFGDLRGLNEREKQEFVALYDKA